MFSFMLKYPDPQEIKNTKEMKSSLLKILDPFEKFYYEMIEKEIIERMDLLNQKLFESDSKNLKSLMNTVVSEVIRLIQFVGYELRDNIKTAEIFNGFAGIALKIIG